MPQSDSKQSKHNSGNAAVLHCVPLSERSSILLICGTPNTNELGLNTSMVQKKSEKKRIHPLIRGHNRKGYVTNAHTSLQNLLTSPK